MTKEEISKMVEDSLLDEDNDKEYVKRGLEYIDRRLNLCNNFCYQSFGENYTVQDVLKLFEILGKETTTQAMIAVTDAVSKKEKDSLLTSFKNKGPIN